MDWLSPTARSDETADVSVADKFDLDGFDLVEPARPPDQSLDAPIQQPATVHSFSDDLTSSEDGAVYEDDDEFEQDNSEPHIDAPDFSIGTQGPPSLPPLKSLNRAQNAAPAQLGPITGNGTASSSLVKQHREAPAEPIRQCNSSAAVTSQNVVESHATPHVQELSRASSGAPAPPTASDTAISSTVGIMKDELTRAHAKIERLERALESAQHESHREIESARALHERILLAKEEQHTATIKAQMDALRASHEHTLSIAVSAAESRAKQAEDSVASRQKLLDAEMTAFKSMQQELLDKRMQQATEEVRLERERHKKEMAQAQALLQSALEARDKAQAEAIASTRALAAEEVTASRQLMDDRISALQREHHEALASRARIHEDEQHQTREMMRATLAARERLHADQLKEAADLHRDQLAAYRTIEKQGGILHSLTGAVSTAAQGLIQLKERMEQDLWKSILKGEAAMMEKESALNEVQRQREKLWGQRETLFENMRHDMDAERSRMASAWERGKEEWEQITKEHHEMRVALSERQIEFERFQERMVAEIAQILTQFQAERALLSQERNIHRSERSALSSALIKHSSDVSRYRESVFSASESMRAEHERSVSELASVAAQNEQKRRAAAFAERSSAFQIAVAAKERSAASSLFASLQEDREALGEQSASQAQRIIERQQLLREQTSKLLEKHGLAPSVEGKDIPSSSLMDDSVTASATPHTLSKGEGQEIELDT